MARYPAGNRYEIKLPLLAANGLCLTPGGEPQHTADRSLPHDVIVVVPRSPVAHRRAVERLGIYLKREQHFDFPPYDAEEAVHYSDQAQDVAFLWTTHRHADLKKDEWVHPAIGACGFRWRKWSDAPEGWALAWVWFHPYERRQGHLTRAWPYFRERFGDFLAEPPLSAAMKSFVRKMQETIGAKGDTR
jgi:hypothetical protein